MRVGLDKTGSAALTAILLVHAACNCDAPKADASQRAGADEPVDVETQPSPAPAWGRALSASGPKEAELLRDPGHPGLQRAVQSDGAAHSRAVWALARIGGDAARQTLQRIALSPRSDSTELAALSFLEPPRTEPSVAPDPEGPWSDLEDAVWSRYAVSEELAEAESLLLAAARLGGPASQQRLAADTEVAPDPADVPRYRAAFEAMGILCARGHGLSRPGLRSIGTALQAGGDVAVAAAYALGRCAGPSAEQLAGEERAAVVRLVEPLLTAGDDAARHGWRALAALGENPESVPVAVLHPSEPPAWTTEVEAVRALAGHADGRGLLVDRLVAIAPASIEGTRVHVVLEALRSLRDGVVGTPELVHRMGPWVASVEAATAGATGRSVKALALVRCETRLLQAILNADLEPLRTCSIGIDGLPSTYGESLSVEALLRIADAMPSEDRVIALLKLAADPRPPVAAPALSAIADVDHARVNPALVEALGRDDAGVRAAAAGSIAARAVDAVRRDPEALPALVRLAGARDPALFEARLAAIEALGSLARSSPEASPTPWLESVVLPLHQSAHAAVRRTAREALLGAPALLAKFDELSGPPAKGPFDVRVHEAVQAFDEDAATGLRVRTEAGTFTISFEHAPAHIAQAVLTSLTRQKYFDGLTFHRVVPAFVIQGGDPRGDGYGGPGFVMPCERSNVRYERGTVGMALAGKDTGGSQFFVTHTPQPHLDARYPVIGFVREADLAVVDAILPHDRIIEVTVLPGESDQ